MRGRLTDELPYAVPQAAVRDSAPASEHTADNGDMDRAAALAATTAAQLASGLIGLVVATRRRLPANYLGLHLELPAGHLLRDSTVMGTAQSAPLVMMALQAEAIHRLLGNRRPSVAARAERTLGWLGVAMVAGCLVERESPLWRGHRDRVATPPFAASLLDHAAHRCQPGRADEPAGPLDAVGIARHPFHVVLFDRFQQMHDVHLVDLPEMGQHPRSDTSIVVPVGTTQPGSSLHRAKFGRRLDGGRQGL